MNTTALRPARPAQPAFVVWGTQFAPSSLLHTSAKNFEAGMNGKQGAGDGGQFCGKPGFGNVSKFWPPRTKMRPRWRTAWK